MAATANAFFRFSPARSSSSPTTNTNRPIYSLVCPNSYKPLPVSKKNPTISISRKNVLHTEIGVSKPVYKVLAFSGVVNGDSETHPESETKDSKTDATIDIKLPRRSLLVQFTCDLCGEKTKRLVNRLAYERGLIYVQCAGCLQHHKLVDNLGLVVEYDLREEINADGNKDEV
ncbi:hypothetical protein FEM48_Zijuj10G0153700 [Ziziphus jujuba var. spinosa]|uniref:DNL-type domain-containing protein n=1 Tax=Ziziphus jujuba var. spinosa TaxID=714518 RepID=A0A978UP62_ZIZJJ|nr:hypothetical protein FEM48_Zijuj10G0153700 [Ziziphus jujuba var. spinosa]